MAKRDAVSEKEIEDWAEIVINGWIYKMTLLDMCKPENSGVLIQSLKYEIEWHEPDENKIEYLRKIQFSFRNYGKFVDYGLGRGTDIVSRFERGKDSRQNKRKRKKWILEPWMEALHIIAPIIGGHLVAQITKYLTREFPKEDDYQK